MIKLSAILTTVKKAESGKDKNNDFVPTSFFHALCKHKNRGFCQNGVSCVCQWSYETHTLQYSGVGFVLVDLLELGRVFAG